MRVYTVISLFFFTLMLLLRPGNDPGSGAALGQTVVTTVKSTTTSAPVITTPSYGAPVAMPLGHPGMVSGKTKSPKASKPGSKKGGPSGKSKKSKGKSDVKKGNNKGDSSKEVKRPAEPPKPPDPEELKVQPDKDNKVKVNFKGQPWPAVLEWLADISGMSFDWQEAPGGYLNLTTKRSYTVEEVRDRINRLLLERGYTLLGHDEVMSLVSIKKINPSMVPRITPEKLADTQPHEFVKVSFVLNLLTADAMVEELKPMLSPNGKLVPMRATNRIEAVDAVVNLREIYALLNREQSDDKEHSRPRMFKLKYRHASEVVPQLQTLLGLSSKKPSGAMTAQQKMQAQQQAMMRAQQQKKSKKTTAPKPAVAVHLLADDRNNVILVQAPPDKMAVIAQTIKVIDVPLARKNTLQATLGRMQIYHLSSMSPEPLIKTLNAIGNLDLDTQLEVDEDNKSIIAYATLADHVTIRALIDKLDGSSRRFEVIPLRRLEADYVAGTIKLMIFGGEEEPKKNNNSSRYFGYFGSSSSRSKKKSKNTDRFRVDADVEHNRLLLWVNDTELEDVRKFLVKLGEIPPEGGNPATIRVLGTFEDADAAALIKRLRRIWPDKNRIEDDVTPIETQELEAGETRGKSVQQTGRPEILLAQFRQDTFAEKPRVDALPAKPRVTKPAAKPQTADAPAIMITRNAEGRIVIASKDTAALDRLEQLIGELSPPPKNYKLFRLKHAWAFDISSILEKFFKEESEGKENVWDPYYWGYRPSDKPKVGARLSKRRPLRFIVDSESNSILVQGASAEQLHQIQKLIDFYDRIDKTDSQNIRQTATFTIRYSKARVIAEAIKEVYRDLLSASDKAFSANKKNQNRRQNRFTYIFGSGDGDDQVTKAPKFKGLLSIGVDDISNTLIVSAPTYLFVKVSEMIQTLDRSAWPVANVRVVRIGESISSEQLEKVLMAVTGGTYAKGKSTEKKAASQSTPK